MARRREISVEQYWDIEYPLYIEVPEGYWVSSHDVEYEIAS